MKNLLSIAALVLASALAVAPSVSDAKRFGGGNSSGMQRSMPAATPNKAVPPTAPAQGAAAAAGKRSWLGPIAGLAAGIGLVALMSHLGLGEEFANFLMLALLAVAILVAVRYFMRRNAQPPKLATAGAPAPAWDKPAAEPVMQRNALATPAAGDVSADGSTRLAPLGKPASALPPDFDAEGFARIAKMIFIRMQAANDAGDLNDLRSFTTPEMFAVAKLELQERGSKTQTTDVVKVEAEVLDLEQSGERQVVSVRFHGQIREEVGAAATDFDEIWHLVRWGDNPSWAIAGIQQRQ